MTLIKKRSVKTLEAVGVFCLSVAIAGCQTVGPVPSASAANGSNNNGAVSNTAGGAVLGCIGGAVLAAAIGSNAAKGCGAGAIIGGVSGYAMYQQQMQEARKIQQEMQGTPYKVTLTEKTVPAKDASTGAPAASGKKPVSTGPQPAPESRLATMTLDIPPSAVDSKDPALETIAKKIALVAAKDPNGAVITVEGNKSRRDYLVALLNRSVNQPAQKNIRIESRPSSASTKVMVAPIG